MNSNNTDDKITPEGTSIPPRTGLTPDALPEVQKPILAENSPTGVSTNCVQPETESQTASEDSKNQNPNVHWYALRATYGRESKCNDYLVSQGVETYYPTI